VPFALAFRKNQNPIIAEKVCQTNKGGANGCEIATQ
jgi:hypothetical protein